MADNYAYDEDFLSLSLFITRYSLNDKKYKCCTKDEKREICKLYKTSGKSLYEFSSNQNIPFRNLKNWLKKYS